MFFRKGAGQITAIVLFASTASLPVISQAQDTQTATPQSGDSRTGETQDLAEGTVATVNGQPISQLMHNLVMSRLQMQGQNPHPDQVRTELINLTVLTQKGEAINLQDNEELQSLLKLQYLQTLAQAYMREISKDIEISEEQLREEYDRQTAAMNIDEYRASHILLEEEDAAKEIIKALDDGGDFAELAKEHSTGPTGPNGGDLGWFQVQSMVPAFSQAVEQMEIGSYSKEPVKSEFGWHVILLVDKRGTNKPKFEDVQDELRDIVMRDRLAQEVARLRQEADVKTAPSR